MAQLFHLSSSNVSDTFHKLVQTEGGKFSDGSGSAISFITSAATSSMTVLSASYAISSSHEITYEMSSSYAQSSSLAECADEVKVVTNNDNDEFYIPFVRDNNPAAACETLHTNDFFYVNPQKELVFISGKLLVKGSEVSIADGHISASGNITASGNISSSGTIIASTLGTDAEYITSASIGHLQTFGDTIKFVDPKTKKISGSLKFDENGLTIQDSVGSGKTGTKLKWLFADSYIQTEGDITASGHIYAAGNISSSENITARRIYFRGEDLNENYFSYNNSDAGLLYRGSFGIQGHLTASKNIWQSGSSNHIFADGNISSSLSVIGASVQTPILIGDTSEPTSLEIGGSVWASSSRGHITASGNISASGDIIATGTAQFSKILIDGEVALDTEDSATTGVLFGDTQITKIQMGKPDAVTSNVFSGNISSSGHISASGAIYALDYKIAGQKTAVDYIAANTQIVYGQNNQHARIRGATIELGEPAQLQHVTSSGNIKANGYISASGMISTKQYITLGTEVYDNNFLTFGPTPGSKYFNVIRQPAGNELQIERGDFNGTPLVKFYMKQHAAKPDTVQISGSLKIRTGDVTKGTLEVASHVTASANISASGNIIADDAAFQGKLEVGKGGVNTDGIFIGDGGATIFNIDGLRLQPNTQDPTQGTTPHVTVGAGAHITASGDISSSGNIYAENYFVEGKALASYTNNTDRITLGFNQGGIKLRGEEIFFGEGTNDLSEVTAYGNITASGTGAGNIYAEGYISASGHLYGNAIVLKKSGPELSEFLSSTGDLLQVYQGTKNIFNFGGGSTDAGNSSETLFSANNNINIKTVSSSLSSEGKYSGNAVYSGNSTTVAGKIYAHTGSGWTIASSGSNIASMSLGLALGSNSTTNGMLLNGIARINGTIGVTGAPLYLGDGGVPALSPTGTDNHYARVVGYNHGNNTFYFCPDNTWVKKG